MSAASQAKRMGGDDLEVVAVERGRWTSYSACGIPYWLGGEVDRREDLIARTPEQHRANGIDVRLGCEAVELDTAASVVTVRDAESGECTRLRYDEVLVATGSRPVRPNLPGIDGGGVFGVHTLDDGQRILAALASPRTPRCAAVVGGGYIGVEVAEALVRRGLAVTLVEQAAEPMSVLDPDLGRVVRAAMEEVGVRVRVGTAVTGFEVDGDGWVRGVGTVDGTVVADLVALGIGVQPEVDLAAAAGLPIGEHGGVRTDARMAVAPGVWAAGDCVEVRDRVLDRWVRVALGTHANKQGRVVGINVGGGDAAFGGVVGTAITRFDRLEAARTGALPAEARAAGLDVVTETVETTTHAGYLPDAEPMTVRMVAERGCGRVVGAQIVGGAGAAKRIDVCALAVWTRMSVAELAMSDLAYAPPYSSVWDPVQVAARALCAEV
ncbi:MAG: FAD-dependent oxidoreductase [Actinomycetota bacterium]|nr:FAD-dependent oxidoreductase [Actinomycetota bacterium]